MEIETIDSIAVQVAQTLFTAFHKVHKVAMNDQLPNPDLVEDTLSIIPHNKFELHNQLLFFFCLFFACCHWLKYMCNPCIMIFRTSALPLKLVASISYRANH
jgi:hypothetical protein